MLPVPRRRDVRGSFETEHAGQVTGTVAMFDRMIFKGHLPALYEHDGARCFSWSQGVGLKDFAPWAEATTATIAEHVRSLASSAGRPVVYFEHAVRTISICARKTSPVPSPSATA